MSANWVFLDWHWLAGEPVVDASDFSAMMFQPNTGHDWDKAVADAMKIVEALRDCGVDARRRQHRVYFSDMKLASMAWALQAIDLDWSAFKKAFRWREVKPNVAPPEPRP